MRSVSSPKMASENTQFCKSSTYIVCMSLSIHTNPTMQVQNETGRQSFSFRPWTAFVCARGFVGNYSRAWFISQYLDDLRSSVPSNHACTTLSHVRVKQLRLDRFHIRSTFFQDKLTERLGGSCALRFLVFAVVSNMCHQCNRCKSYTHVHLSTYIRVHILTRTRA